MLRVWSEHLPFEDAAQPETLALLERFGLQPMFAVRPGDDLDALNVVLERCHARDIEAGIWPLLHDEDGYWPSEHNGAQFAARVNDLLEALPTPVAWLAVDLEPPLGQIDALRHRLSVGALAMTMRHNLNAARFAASCELFDGLARRLDARGLATLAITVPMAAHDLRHGRDMPLWQDLFEAPWSSVGWTSLGVMAYGSLVSGYSQGLLSEQDARAVLYRLMCRLARHAGPAAHVSLGVTGIGKLGDEPCYTQPSQLAADAAAARAAGIEDLGIFCLEGLLAQPRPGAWLDAVSNATPRAPEMTPRAHAIRLAATVARRALSSLRRG